MLDLEIRPTDNPAVKVAKDVLQQLDGLNLRRQTFGTIALPVSELPVDGDLKTQILPKVTALCPTCLKGSCVLSMARVLDRPMAYGHEDHVENGYRQISLGDYINAPKRYLGVFSHRTWHMMEAAFEMAPGIPPLHRIPDEETEKIMPYLLAAAHFGRQIKDDYERVKVVMENLLRHNGEFTLEPILADNAFDWWKEHYGAEAWSARDIVPKTYNGLTVPRDACTSSEFDGKVLGANPWDISNSAWMMSDDREYFPDPTTVLDGKDDDDEEEEEEEEECCSGCGQILDDCECDDEDDDVCPSCGDIDCDGSCEDLDDDDDEDDFDDDDDDVDVCSYCGGAFCDGECQDDDEDDEDWDDDDDDDIDDDDDDIDDEDEDDD